MWKSISFIKPNHEVNFLSWRICAIATYGKAKEAWFTRAIALKIAIFNAIALPYIRENGVMKSPS